MRIHKTKNKVPPIDTDIYITNSAGKQIMPDSATFTGEWPTAVLRRFMVAHDYLYWKLKENN